MYLQLIFILVLFLLTGFHPSVRFSVRFSVYLVFVLLMMKGLVCVFSGASVQFSVQLVFVFKLWTAPIWQYMSKNWSLNRTLTQKCTLNRTLNRTPTQKCTLNRTLNRTLTQKCTLEWTLTKILSVTGYLRFEKKCTLNRTLAPKSKNFVFVLGKCTLRWNPECIVCAIYIRYKFLNCL